MVCFHLTLVLWYQEKVQLQQLTSRRDRPGWSAPNIIINFSFCTGSDFSMFFGLILGSYFIFICTLGNWDFKSKLFGFELLQRKMFRSFLNHMSTLNPERKILNLHFINPQMGLELFHQFVLFKTLTYVAYAELIALSKSFYIQRRIQNMHGESMLSFSCRQ